MKEKNELHPAGQMPFDIFYHNLIFPHFLEPNDSTMTAPECISCSFISFGFENPLGVMTERFRAPEFISFFFFVLVFRIPLLTSWDKRGEVECQWETIVGKVHPGRV